MKKLFIGALLLGCTAGVKPADTGSGGTGSPGGGGSTGNTTGVSGSSGNNDAAPYDAPMSETLGPDAACAAEQVNAQPVPLDLYVLMDSSKSMLEMTSDGKTKWNAVAGAMSAFFNNQGSAGLGVAIKYFPSTQTGVPETCTNDGQCGNYGPCDFRKTCVGATSSTTQVTPLCADASTCGTQECSRIKECGAGSNSYCAAGTMAASTACSGCSEFSGYCHNRDICTSATYATPDIALTTLPNASLGTSLMGHAPGGFTPTGPALTGALTYARQRLASAPDHRVAVVLVTDGLPGGFLPGFPPAECAPSDIAGVSGIAGGAMGAMGNPPVLTFVIGVFAPGVASTTAQTNLDMLAMKGGTAPAVVINTGEDVTAKLQEALKRVQSKAIACSYKIPTSTTNTVDPKKVNVQFTPSSGPPVIVGKAASKAACTAQGGWYYDNEANPTEIIACDASCQMFQTDVNGHVDIQLGCVTIMID